MPTLTFRVSEDLAGHLDRVRGEVSRSDFIRELIERSFVSGGSAIVTARVSDAVPPKVKDSGEMMAEKARALRASKPVVSKPAGDRWAADKAALLGALRERRMTAREASLALGWNVMRVDAVVKQMAGLIEVKAGGVMEAV